MWILPKQLRESFLTARGLEDSKLDLSEQGLILSQSFFWRSKAYSAKTWLLRWKRVLWLQRLSGAILKPSTHSPFVEWWTASWGATRASRFQSPVNKKGKKMKELCGPTSPNTSESYDLFGAFLKTFQTTLTSDMKLSGENYKTWATMLKKEYTLRKKSALLTKEKDCLSSLSELTWRAPQNRDWKGASGGHQKEKDINYQVQFYQNWPTPTPTDIYSENLKSSQQKEGSMHSVTLPQAVKKNWTTPVASDSDRTTKYKQGGTALSLQVKNWKTPDCSDRRSSPSKQQGLSNQVTQWPTPTAAEGGKIGNNANYGQKALGNHPEIVGLPTRKKTKKGDATGGLQDQEKSNTTGSTPEPSQKKSLNPLWVAQLQGITFEKIFFVHLETP